MFSIFSDMSKGEKVGLTMVFAGAALGIANIANPLAYVGLAVEAAGAWIVIDANEKQEQPKEELITVMA